MHLSLFSALSQQSRLTVGDKSFVICAKHLKIKKRTASLPPGEVNQSPTSCMACCALPSPLNQSVQIFLTNVSINSVTMANKINTVSFHQTVLLAFLSLSLSWPLPLFFPLSVQTATHSPAQSEWSSYADHFFHLSSPPLPLPLLRLWKVCLSFHALFSHVLLSCWAWVANSHNHTISIP